MRENLVGDAVCSKEYEKVGEGKIFEDLTHRRHDFLGAFVNIGVSGMFAQVWDDGGLVKFALSVHF